MEWDHSRMTMEEHCRPSVLYRPRLFIDGNQWCALYGENLQDGVAGFGDSPALAMLDWERNWSKRLPATSCPCDNCTPGGGGS